MNYNVKLKASGHEFTCTDTQNVLEAGLKAGLMIPYNCRSGFCRTCKSRIVSGSVNYADKPMSHYLSAEEHAEGFALLCQAHPSSDLVVDTDEIVGIENITARHMPGRIFEMDRLAPDVMRVRLRLPSNENVRFFPGQHLSFDLGDGVTREYSIANACGSAGVTEFELHIRHTPGGLFTDRLFEEIKLRTIMQFEAPLGTFFLRPDSHNPVIFLATGTGFAPIKSMIEQAISTGEIGRRTFRLYWGGRTEADLYMLDLVRSWVEDYPNLSFVPVLSRQGRADGASPAYVQDRVLEDYPDLSSFDIYACGSPAMIDDARTRFEALDSRKPAHFRADEFLTAAERAAGARG